MSETINLNDFVGKQDLEWARLGITVWQPCNIMPTAHLKEGVSVGVFTEIGTMVKIGENTRIGAQCFIPEGVIIGKNCFIAPRVCFTNDLYPPSDRENWQKTIIEDYAAIGANSTILCGLIIGKNSTVGAGSVVTKNIPENEIWAGNPAKFLRKK